MSGRRRGFTARNVWNTDDFFSFKHSSIEDVQEIGVLYKLWSTRPSGVITTPRMTRMEHLHWCSAPDVPDCDNVFLTGNSEFESIALQAVLKGAMRGWMEIGGGTCNVVMRLKESWVPPERE